MPPLTRACAAAEEPALLDTLARPPATAALVVAALDRMADRMALRPPTARRWPRLETLFGRLSRA
jgi:hypothetical protein